LTADLRRKDDIIKAKTDALVFEVANKLQIKELNFASTLDGKNWTSGVNKSKTAFVAFYREIEKVLSSPNATQEDFDNLL
jgi:hypothetical protein